MEGGVWYENDENNIDGLTHVIDLKKDATWITADDIVSDNTTTGE